MRQPGGANDAVVPSLDLANRPAPSPTDLVLPGLHTNIIAHNKTKILLLFTYSYFGRPIPEIAVRLTLAKGFHDIRNRIRSPFENDPITDITSKHLENLLVGLHDSTTNPQGGSTDEPFFRCWRGVFGRIGTLGLYPESNDGETGITSIVAIPTHPYNRKHTIIHPLTTDSPLQSLTLPSIKTLRHITPHKNTPTPRGPPPLAHSLSAHSLHPPRNSTLTKPISPSQITPVTCNPLHTPRLFHHFIKRTEQMPKNASSSPFFLFFSNFSIAQIGHTSSHSIPLPRRPFHHPFLQRIHPARLCSFPSGLMDCGAGEGGVGG